MAKRKKHLKYRAQHRSSDAAFEAVDRGPEESTPSVANDDRSGTLSVNGSQSRLRKQQTGRAKVPAIVTGMDSDAVRVVRQEILHLAISASVIVIMYAGLWLLLARAGLEAKLTSLIRL